jgi:hypothetical protein
MNVVIRLLCEVGLGWDWIECFRLGWVVWIGLSLVRLGWVDRVWFGWFRMTGLVWLNKTSSESDETTDSQVYILIQFSFRDAHFWLLRFAPFRYSKDKTVRTSIYIIFNWSIPSSLLAAAISVGKHCRILNFIFYCNCKLVQTEVEEHIKVKV